MDPNKAMEGSPPQTQDPTWAQKLLTSLPQKPPKANLPFLQWILHSHKVSPAFRAMDSYYAIFNPHYSNHSYKSLCHVLEKYLVASAFVLPTFVPWNTSLLTHPLRPPYPFYIRPHLQRSSKIDPFQRGRGPYATFISKPPHYRTLLVTLPHHPQFCWKHLLRSLLSPGPLLLPSQLKDWPSNQTMTLHQPYCSPVRLWVIKLEHISIMGELPHHPSPVLNC